MSEPTDTNPYQPPSSLPAAPIDLPRTTSGVRIACVVHLLVILVGIVVEWFEHETIIGIGPVLALTGLWLIRVSFRDLNRAGILLGMSTIGLCVLVVLLIIVNRWGPAQGDRPITILGYLYTLYAVPLGIVALLSRGRPRRTSIRQNLLS